MKKYQLFFFSENFQVFFGGIFSIYLNRRVFVMSSTDLHGDLGRFPYSIRQLFSRIDLETYF